MIPKFRLWHKYDKEFKDLASINFGIKTIDYLNGAGFLEDEDFDNVVLQQFTGLKDKNGTEVFVGDLLRYTRFHWNCHGHPKDGTDLIQIHEIYWDDERAAFRHRSENCNGYLSFEDSRAERNEIEVIGNILQNPDVSVGH